MTTDPPAQQRAAPAQDANARLDAMWQKHIKPALDKLTGDDAALVEQVTDLRARLDATRQALVTSLYDPMALKLLDAEMCAAQDIIRSTPEKARDILAELERSKARERKFDLEQQAEDIIRPLRVAIRSETYTNEADKIKFKHPNDDARDDELAERLSRSKDYQAVQASLDEVLMEKALAKGALEDLERERKSASQLLRSYEAQLNNLTARLINPTPMNIGGNNDG